MKYFKNSELTKLYRVSDKSVRNWIKAAQLGKNDLTLYENRGHLFIADTLDNAPIIEALVDRGRKYRNERSHRNLYPSALFYKLYTPAQIIEIINSLEIHNEYPLQYRYCGKGAAYWDAYLNKLANAGSANLLTASQDLLREDWAYIKRHIDKYEFINVVDLGVGNGLAIKETLQKISATGKLKRYIGIDLSKELLKITETNLKSWVSMPLKIERHTRDICKDHFSDILARDSYGKDASSTINLVFFLGSTLMNFREPAHVLATIRESLGKSDLLISTLKLDSSAARRFFDFNIKSDTTILPSHQGFMLDLLSIDETIYEIEQFFDEIRKSRFIQVRLKTSISIHFRTLHFSKTVNLEKGNIIILARIRHWSAKEAIDLYDSSYLEPVRSATSDNGEYLLSFSKSREIA